MSPIDFDTEFVQNEFDLSDDLESSCFNAHDSGHIKNVVRAGLAEVHAWSAHDFTQSVSFDSELILCLVFLGLGKVVDDGSRDRGNALDENSGEPIFKILHHKRHFVAAIIVRLDVYLALVDYCDVLVLHLQLRSLEDRHPDRCSVDVQLQSIHSRQVNLDRQIAALRGVHFLDVLCDISELCLLNSSFSDTSSNLSCAILKLGIYDRGADFVCSVDDLLDSWHTESYIHRGDPSEVESFQGHLRGWLGD